MSPLTEPTRIILRNGWQPMDPDAAAYITAVETADGQALEEPVKIAIDNFVLGCKADGIWDAIKASCILAGARTLEGALVPLKGAAPTNIGFNSSDYDRKTGLKNSDNLKYLDTNRSNGADPNDSTSMSVYATDIGTDTSGQYIGDHASNNAYQYTCIFRNAGNYFLRNRNTATPVIVTESTGFVGTSRSNISNFDYRCGGISGNQIASVSILIEYNYLLYLRPVLGQSANPRLSFYHIGESLDLALLDARVTDLINKFAEVIP